MNLKHLTDETLLTDTDSIVQKGRENLVILLHHLLENDRRRLFSALGFKSLFEYCVKRLKCSEDEAYRRINAMKLLRSLDEESRVIIEERLSTGALKLSHLSMAQSHFRNEEKFEKKRSEKISQEKSQIAAHSRESDSSQFAFAASHRLVSENQTGHCNQLGKIPTREQRGAPEFAGRPEHTAVSQQVTRMELLQGLEDLSIRESERKLLSLSSETQTIPLDKVRPICAEHFEVKFVCDEALLDKIELLKNILAHRLVSGGKRTGSMKNGINNGNVSSDKAGNMAVLMNLLCDLGLKTWDLSIQQTEPRTKDEVEVEAGSKTKSKEEVKPETKTDAKLDTNSEAEIKIETISKLETEAKTKSDPKASLQKNTSVSRRKHRGRAIPASVKRFVWRRDQGKCQRCSSRHALQMDHRVPRALGGDDSPENIRLLCRHCNQRAAIEALGVDKMEAYLRH